MIEHLTGTLTSGYTIPDYAQEKLLLQGEGESASVTGASGEFSFTSAPSAPLTLRWLDKTGPALGVFRWQPDSLGWDGQIRIGGYLDAIHFQPLPGTDRYVAALYLGGHPLQSQFVSGESGAQTIRMGQKADFNRGLSAYLTETVTTWILDHNHPLAAQAQTVLLRNTRMHLFGQLATDHDPVSAQFDLPIRLRAMTIFAP